MNRKETILDYVQYSHQGMGHVQRMEDHRLSRRVMIWNSPGRRKQGRPRHTWMNEVTQIIA